MTPRDYLLVLRRRRLVILSAVVISLGVGWATTSVVSVSSVKPSSSYTATVIILSSGGSASSGGGITNLDTLAALAKVGEVPERVAQELDRDDPLTLASTVQATPDKETGLLTITAVSGEPREAKLLADTFATQLLDYVKDNQRGIAMGQLKTLTRSIGSLESQVADIDREIASADASGQSELRRERKTLATRLQLQEASFQQLSDTTTQSAAVQIIQKATPQLVAAPTTGGFEAPPSRAARVGIGAILGLIAGFVLALLLDHFDTRLRTKQAAEDAFGVPVLSQVPAVRRRGRRHLPLGVATVPTSAWADAFRYLASAVERRYAADGHRTDLTRLTVPPQPSSRTSTPAGAPLPSLPRNRSDIVIRAQEPIGIGEGRDRRAGRLPRTILITSPGPGEGKSTVATNLAAAFTEMGHSTLLISCDFHRPSIHNMLEVSNHPGLVDALKSESGHPILNGHVRQIAAEGLAFKVLPTGSIPERPGELLSSEKMRTALVEARQIADVVLIDTPPILTTSDAILLLSQVDAVVLVARAGKTTAQLAEQSGELLSRQGAPLLGVVLNRAVEMGRPGYGRKPSKLKMSRRSKDRGRTDNVSNNGNARAGGPERTKGFPRLSRHQKTS